MRVLVTGANGFAGWHVCAAFAGHRLERMDISDPFPDRPVDTVVSLAATANPWQAQADPAAAYTNNTTVMVETLDYARRVGARVLHVSTNEVYGTGSGPALRPQGPYAGAKACQEMVCHTYPDVPVTIVVTQSLFGEHQQADKLVPTAIRNLLRGEPVKLQANGAGWSHRPFMHAHNLAHGLRFLAEYPQDGHHRFHVGMDEKWSVRGVVEVLARELRREPLIEKVDAGDRAGHELDVEPIGNNIPGWRPVLETESGLRRTARWYARQA